MIQSLDKEVSETLDKDIVTQYFRGRTRSTISYKNEDGKACQTEKVE